MAVHDEQRRSRFEDTRAGGKWVAFVIGLGLILMVAFILMNGSDTPEADGIQTPQKPTTTAPLTTAPAPTKQPK
jgi:hypothetical protein